MIVTSTYKDLKQIIHGKKIPFVICDKEAFNYNLHLVGEFLRSKKKKLRLCTKSVRVPKLIHEVVQQDFVNGLFCFNSAELLFYAEEYKIEDLLLGYPIMSDIDAQELAKAASVDEKIKVSVMADSKEHLEILEKAAKQSDVEFSIILEMDVADSLLGMNIGVYRSPLRTPKEIVELAREVENYPHLTYKGIMGYEAQNASLGDDKWLYRVIKKRSRTKVNKWRQEIVDSLTSAGLTPEIVNGGGSGSFQETASEPSITEIGIGSLLFKSYIFDAINTLKDFIPALFFVLQVVRKPKKNIVTAFSGGYVSSGVRAPPIPVKPENLKTIKNEGFGEVQTPFVFNPNKIDLTLGDPIFCRFGKAGEPLERFNEVHIYSEGTLIDTYPTYRGLGYRFS